MLTIILVLALACVHFFAGNIKSLRGTPRSKWLSFAGGVSVTYIFIHLLSELVKSKSEVEIKETIYWFIPSESIFLLLLLGFTAFYGLEKMVQGSMSAGGVVENKNVFFVHVTSFTVYNFIIGTSLVNKNNEVSTTDEVVRAVAFGLHFLGNDFSLYSDFKKRYRRYGRWVLGSSILAGYAVNYFLFIGEAWITLALSVVGGAIILNSIKEELPAAHKASFLAYLGGVIGYACLLYLIK